MGKFDDEVKNQVSLLIGANLGNLISQDVIDRVMSIKTAKLRKILNKKLAENIKIKLGYNCWIDKTEL